MTNLPLRIFHSDSEDHPCFVAWSIFRNEYEKPMIDQLMF